MLLPKNAADRKQRYEEIVKECLASRNDRFQFYETLRNYYLFGSSDGAGAPYNKILSTIETLSSFIYSPESTRFSIHLGTTAPEGDLGKVTPMSAEITDQWKQSGTHLTFQMGINWSFVFGSMLFKVLWKNGVAKTYLVEPHQFGVLREDISDLAEQEAVVHCYSITKTQLEAELDGNPRKGEIMHAIASGASEGGTEFGGGMSRLLLSGPINGVPGSVATGQGGAGGVAYNGQGGYDYVPRVDAELVDMMELYVWDDEINDYQQVTIANPDIIVYDRKNTGVSTMLPFVKLSPEHTTYNYFWGSSFTAKLTWLQDMRTKRMFQISDALEKQFDPATALPGWQGIAEEKMLALRKAGGFVAGPMGSGKPERFTMEMPTNVFSEVDAYDKMFDDQAGIGHILQGKGEPGVRSKGQADLMARLGSARPKTRALVVEESAEDIATLMLRNIQDHSKQRFHSTTEKEPDGKGALVFIPAQFTQDYEVKVDSHSTSPIFIEDTKADADAMLEAHAITRARWIEMRNPPNKQLLLMELKEIEAAEQKAKEEMAAKEEKEARDKASKKKSE